MHCCPTTRRLLAGLLTAVVIAALSAFLFLSGKHDPQPLAAADARPSGNWPLFGGSAQRNMVNLVEKNVPTDWDVRTGKNIKWVAELGSKAYGGPIIADGKVFIGTNNDRPRNQRDVDPMTKDPVDK